MTHNVGDPGHVQAHNDGEAGLGAANSNISILQGQVAALSAGGGGSYKGAWAPSTAYALGDLVTHVEGIYAVTLAHTSSTTFSLTNLTRLNGRRGVWDVTDYGATGDGTTDDQAAINEAVQTACASAVADGTYFAEVYFPPGTYQLGSATIKGDTALGHSLGVAKGNAQIPIPILASTGRKLVLAFRGAGPSGFAHWEETVGQRSGSVLRSTLTSLTSDGTWGPPSIIGGPTVYDDGAGFPFANVMVIVDDLTIMAPYNPGIIALDLRDIAQMEIGRVSILADAGPAGSPSLATRPTNDLGIALRCPRNGNNDLNLIHSLGVEGFYYGMTMGEHLTAVRLAIIYAQVGLFLNGVGGTSYHGATFLNLNLEATTTGFQAIDSDGGAFPLRVLTLSVESVDTTVSDPNGNLYGTIELNDAATANLPVVSSASKIKVISHQAGAAPGAKTAPSVPASTTPLTNPFWRDCGVVVAGGTVTAIAVDGQAQGVTSGLVVVPSGKTITLTYSSAPTWKWVAM
jgi:pectate lyase-like protein